MILREIEVSTIYIPKWNGNQDLPADEQVIVEFSSIPKAVQKNKYIKFEFGQNNTVTIIKEYQLFALSHIKDITGLTMGEKVIKTAKDLNAVTNPKLISLLDELMEYCFKDEELTVGE